MAQAADGFFNTKVDMDEVQVFVIPERNVRGRLARLGPVLDRILADHGYPPVIEALLAEALVLTALLGSTLKNGEGQFTIQAQAQGGPVDLMVCDYRNGEIRGYIRHDAELLAQAGEPETLEELFGTGYFAITFDQDVSGERYQGIVPLEGRSLSDAAERYFAQSEQIPTLVRIATRREGDGAIASGLLLQYLPHGEEGQERLHVREELPEWEHAQALAATLKDEELTDTSLSFQRILWRLFNEEERVTLAEPTRLSRGCRCDLAHIRSVIGRFGDEDRAEMVGDDGLIRVDCAFCAKSFGIDPGLS